MGVCRGLWFALFRSPPRYIARLRIYLFPFVSAPFQDIVFIVFGSCWSFGGGVVVTLGCDISLHPGPLSGSTTPGTCTASRVGNRLALGRLDGHISSRAAIDHTSIITILATAMSGLLRTLARKGRISFNRLNGFHLRVTDVKARGLASFATTRVAKIGVRCIPKRSLGAVFNALRFRPMTDHTTRTTTLHTRGRKGAITSLLGDGGRPRIWVFGMSRLGLCPL